MDPADLVQDALVKYLQLDDYDDVRSPRASGQAPSPAGSGHPLRRWTQQATWEFSRV